MSLHDELLASLGEETDRQNYQAHRDAAWEVSATARVLKAFGLGRYAAGRPPSLTAFDAAFPDFPYELAASKAPRMHTLRSIDRAFTKTTLYDAWRQEESLAEGSRPLVLVFPWAQHHVMTLYRFRPELVEEGTLLVRVLKSGLFVIDPLTRFLAEVAKTWQPDGTR